MITLTKVLPINLKLVDGKKVPIGGMKKTNTVDYVQGMKNFAIHLSDYPDIIVLDLDIKDHKLKLYKDKTYTHETRKGWHCFFRNSYNITNKRQKQKEKFDLLAGENWVYYNYNDPDVATYSEYNQLPIVDMPPELYDLVKVHASDTGEEVADTQFITKPLLDMLKSNKSLWNSKDQTWTIQNSSDLGFAITKELLPYTTEERHIEAVLLEIPEVSEKQSSERLLPGRVKDCIIRLSQEQAIVWRPLSDFRAVSISNDKTRYLDIDRDKMVSMQHLKMVTLPHTKIEMIEQYLRTYDRVEFNPANENKFYGTTYNLFGGWIPEEKGTGHEQYLEYLYTGICRKNDEHYNYLLDYMAHMVQKPTQLPDVALVLYGTEKGTGKDTFHVLLGKIFKRGGYVQLTEEAITGRFNSSLENCLLGISEERMFGGSHKEDSHMKSLITAKTFRIERKGIDAFDVNSYLRLVITSNGARPVRATDGERRYFALSPSTVYKNNHKFWTELYDNFMPEHLLYYLRRRDIKSFNTRILPESQYLNEIIDQNKDKVTEAIEDWWETAKHDDWVDTKALYEQLVDDTKYLTIRQFSRKLFGIVGKESLKKAFNKDNGNGYKVVRPDKLSTSIEPEIEKDIQL